MIYFDNAATSFPKPDIVYESIMKAMKEYELIQVDLDTTSVDSGKRDI